MARRGVKPPFSLFAFQDVVTSVTGIILLLTLTLALNLVVSKPSKSAAPTPAQAAASPESVASLQQQVDAANERLQQLTQQLAVEAGMPESSLRRQIDDLQRELDRLNAEASDTNSRLAEAQDEQDRLRNEESSRDLERAETVALREQIQVAETRLQELREQNRVVYNPRERGGKRAWLVDIGADRILVAPVGQKSRPQEFRGGFVSTAAGEFIQWADGRSSQTDSFVLLVRPSGVEAYHRVEPRLRASRFEFGVDPIGEGVVVIDPEHGASAE